MGRPKARRPLSCAGTRAVAGAHRNATASADAVKAGATHASGRDGPAPRGPSTSGGGGRISRRGRHAEARARRPCGLGPPATGGTTISFRRRRTGAADPAPGASGGYRLLLTDSVIYGGGRALQKVLAAVLLPLYTAFLTPSDYGILGMVIAVTTFLDVFVTLGFDVAFSRFYFDDTSPEGRRRVITNVFWVDTFYPAVLIGLGIAVMPVLAPALLGDQYSEGDWKYFAVALVTLFFTNLNDLPFTLFRLEHKPWVFTAFTLSRVVVQVPLSILFVVVFGWGAMGVLVANLCTAAGLQAAMLPTYMRKLNRLPDRATLRPMIAFAIPALFTGLSFYWLKLSDRFFLLRYQGKAEVGLYTVANGLAQPLFLVLMAFRMAWPQWHFSKLDDEPLHKHLVARSSTYFLTLNAAILVLYGAFLPLLAHVLLNERYWSVTRVSFVIALSIALYGVYFIFWVGANVAKKNRMVPVFFVIASVVNICLNFIFVPEYGMWAAAWAAVAGYAILAGTIYFYSRRHYPIPYEWRRLLTATAAATLTLFAVAAIGRALGLTTSLPLDELFWRTVAITPALLLFPLTLTLAGFFTPGERRRLGDIWRRLSGGGRREPPPAQHESEEEAVEAIELEASLDVAEKGGAAS